MSTEDIVGSPPRGIVPCHNLYQYQLSATGMGPVHMTGLEYLVQVQSSQEKFKDAKVTIRSR